MNPTTYSELYEEYISTETIRARWVAPAIVITTLALSVILCGGIACILGVNLALPVILPAALALLVTIPLWVKAKQYPNHLPNLIQSMMTELIADDNTKKKWDVKTEKEAMNTHLDAMHRSLFPGDDSFLRKKSLCEALKRKIKEENTTNWATEDKPNVCANLDRMLTRISPHREDEEET